VREEGRRDERNNKEKRKEGRDNAERKEGWKT
jgi:hypothetical protein